MCIICKLHSIIILFFFIFVCGCFTSSAIYTRRRVASMNPIVSSNSSCVPQKFVFCSPLYMFFSMGQVWTLRSLKRLRSFQNVLWRLETILAWLTRYINHFLSFIKDLLDKRLTSCTHFITDQYKKMPFVQVSWHYSIRKFNSGFGKVGHFTSM